MDVRILFYFAATFISLTFSLPDSAAAELESDTTAPTFLLELQSIAFVSVSDEFLPESDKVQCRRRIWFDHGRPI